MMEQYSKVLTSLMLTNAAFIWLLRNIIYYILKEKYFLYPVDKQ